MTIKPDMSTKVGLDLTEATKSVKLMANQVKASNSAWKAMETQMKSVGDYVGAAKTKYDGLTKTVEKQKSKIAELKDQQSKLNRNTTEGERAYQQYDVKINNATRQLANYEAQLGRADKALDSQKSGLIGLQHEYKEQNNLSKSLVERYKAEGNERKALETQYAGAKDSLANLNKQYDIQNDKSKKLADEISKSKQAYKDQEVAVRRARNEFGDTSDEYKQARDKLNRLDIAVKESESAFTKQKTAVNKIATSMANAKSDVKSLHEAMNKKPHNFLNGVMDKLKKTSDKTEKLNGLFGKVFGANLLANAASGAWNAISSHVGDAVSMGNEYLEQQDKMSASWKTLTGSAKGSKEMVNAVNDLATSAQNSAEMVNGLANQFYAVDKSKDHVMNLSKATLTLQDAFGATDDEIQNFGKQWSQMMANGKVSAQDFMSFTNVFPALKPALLDYEKDVTHNSKLTMKQLNDMISKGKISSDTMNKVLEDTAKKNQKATENFGKTIPGMTRTVQSSMPKLLGAIEQPFYKMKNPIVGSMSKWVTDKNTTKEFSKLGKTITGALDNITGAFGGSKLDGGKLMDKMLTSLTGSIKDLGKWAKTHKKDIKEFLGNFKEKSVDTIKILGSTLEAFGKVTLPVIKEMAKHPKVAGTFLAGFMIAGKLSGPINAMINMGKATKSMITGFKDLSKVGKILTAGSGIIGVLILLGTTLVELYKHNKKFRKFVDGIVDSCKAVAKKGLGHIKDFGKGFSKVFSSIFTFFKKNWKDIGLLIVNPVAGAFNLLYKHNKKFRDFCNGLVKSAKGMAKSIGSWFGNMKDKAIKHAKKMWDSTKDKFSNGWQALNKGAKNGSNWVSGHFSSLKTTVGKHMGSMWGNAKDNLVKIWDKFKSVFGGLGGIVSGAWKAVHHGMISIARNALKPFNSLLSGIKKGINWVLSKVGAGTIKAKWAIDLPNYAKGTGGILQDQLALVNDAKSSNFREMYHTPDGQVGMFPNQRNMIVPLRKGTEILDGDKSAKLAGLMGLNTYKGGSIGSFFSNIWEKGKDLLEDAENIIAHPIKFMESVFSKHLGKLSSKIELPKQIITHFPATVANAAKDWIKQMFEDASAGGSFDGKITNGWGVYDYLYNIAKKVMKHFGNMHVSSGYRPGDRYFHGKHQAIDIALPPSMNGSRKYRDIGNYAFDHFKKQIGYVITLNRVRDRSGNSGTGIHNAWTNWAEGGHMDHLHLNGMWGAKDIGSGGGGKVSGNHASLLRRAGFKASEIAAADWIVNVESSWNPNAINPTSGAFGLAQSLGHGMAGHGSPLQQLKWMAGYIHGRYGNANKAKSFHKSHNWYANGGIANVPSVFGEDGPEMAIPLSTMKRSRGYELLGKTVTRFAKEDGAYNAPDSTDNKTIKDLNSKFDKMISLLSQIVSNGKDNIKAVRDAAFDKTQMYNQQANDQRMNDIQRLGGI